jgi:hypothetical protein
MSARGEAIAFKTGVLIRGALGCAAEVFVISACGRYLGLW